MTRLIALPLLLLALPARAEPLADLPAIDRAVAQFTGVPQGAPGGAAMPVDRRLRLIACTAALALQWYGARRDTVEVACPTPGGWRLFVPVMGSGAVAAAPVIARGDAVTITVQGDGFAVSQPGEALESGAPGAWIKVRGTSADAKPLRAQVIRPGVVGIALP